MKQAVVTGANRGIGWAIAKGLHERGFEVCLAVRNLEQGRRAANELGERAFVLPVEIGRTESIQAFAQSWSRRGKPLEVLVNCAGIIGEKDMATVDEAEMVELFRIDALGALFLTRALAERFSSGARVVNVSSRLGQLASMGDGYPAYSMAKAALNAATRNLAAWLGPKGVAVNAMCPGWVRTDMGGPSAPLSPVEGADTALFLATEAPAGATGGFYADRKIIPW